MRKKGTTTEWTTKLIGQVVELRGKGYKEAEIAEIMGLTYGSVRGKLQELQAEGKLSEYKRVTPRRYTPADVRDRKIRTLTDHVLDWVWEHPGTRFKMVNDRARGGEKYFVFYCEGKDGVFRYVGIDGDPMWSESAPCTEDNLRTLLTALRRIDLEAGNNG